MIDFKNFWGRLNEKVSVGSYPATLFKDKDGYYTSLEGGIPQDAQPVGKIFLKKDQLPTNLQQPGLAAMYAVANNADVRTDLLHLFRFKKDSQLSATLSWSSVQRLVGLIKQKVQEQNKLTQNGSAVKIVYPESQSIFNNLVKQELESQLDVPVISLNKKKLAEISPKELVPIDNTQRGTSTAVTDKQYKLRQFIHLLYQDYLSSNPNNGIFSKDQLIRDLQQHNKLVGDKINQKVGLSKSELADLNKNGYYRIGDILKDTPSTVFHSRSEIQKGDRVIVFDDNTSTGFTEAQIKRTLGNGVMVPYIIYGLKIFGT